MRLKNILIVVNDIEKSIKFYNELFGLQVTLRQDGNVMMSEGLVLQDAKIWQSHLEKELLPKNHMSVLYFEEGDLDSFLNKLAEYDFPVEYVTKEKDRVRFYDPDGNLIEVRNPF